MKRFYRERLFYLHILIMALLLSALIQHSQGSRLAGQGQRVVFIIDTSASMMTMEGKKSRMELAREEALKVVESLRKPRVMIITAGSRIKTLLPFTENKNVMKSSFKNLNPGDTGFDIETAVIVARPYILKGDLVYLISDGASKEFPNVIRKNPDISFITVGNMEENVGILEIRKHDKGLGDEIDVVVKNFFNDTVRSAIELRINGKIIDVLRIEIPKQGKKIVTFQNVPPFQGTIKASINYSDPFPGDNSRYAVRYLPGNKSILLVTKNNYYLKRLLELIGNIRLTVMTPEKYEAQSQGGGHFDTVIYDNYNPRFESGNFSVYINPEKNVEGVAWGDGYTVPESLYMMRKHPAMSNVDFSDVHIRKAREVRFFEGIELLGSHDTPLIIGFDKNGKKRIVFNFDFEESNFPLSVNFPVFFMNLLSWLQPVESPSMDGVTSGETFKMFLGEKLEHDQKLIVKSPDGSERELKTKEGILSFPYTERAGIYKVILKDSELAFAVNIDASESEIRPFAYQHSQVKKKGISFTSGFPLPEAWKIFGFLAIILFFYESRLRRKPGNRTWN